MVKLECEDKEYPISNVQYPSNAGVWRQHICLIFQGRLAQNP
jgi:hypothetical protein